MTFELNNAPSSFQVLMNVVFKPLSRKSILIFFDGILIYNRNMVSHLADHVKYVFALMKRFQLCAKMSKCAFGVAKVEYLGHFIIVGRCFK